MSLTSHGYRGMWGATFGEAHGPAYSSTDPTPRALALEALALALEQLPPLARFQKATIELRAWHHPGEHPPTWVAEARIDFQLPGEGGPGELGEAPRR